MAISGLVVTLSDNAAAAEALAALAADPRIELGERFGRRVALVAETPGVEADRALWHDLHSTPGIAHVDVTFVHLDHDAQNHTDFPEELQEDRDAHR